MENAKMGMWENLLRNHHKSFKSLFQRNKSSLYGDGDGDPGVSPTPIPQLSPLANSVVYRCSKILQISTQELQRSFDTQLLESVKELLTYARNFLEFCSYRALEKLSLKSDYLNDKDFCRLTYDMMLAWEAPSTESNLENAHSKQEVEDEDEWSLFYTSSTNLALQVDENKTVGPEAFARIAPACSPIADLITVHNLFDALTSSMGHQLNFLVYDKYIRSLNKVIKNLKSMLGPSIGNLQLSEGEIILDIDGIIPTQPVLQHIGISAWPGRLILTNLALYFESLGVGVFEKIVRYDLATDTKQIIKPEMTGPLGARLFDTAVIYKSMTVAEPVYFEFPEFKGNSRRNYWLDVCLEILRVHKFIRKYNLKETQKSEVLARAIFGIFRYRAVREAVRFLSSHYKSILAFNLAESLPRGDIILKTLSSRLANLTADASPSLVLGSESTKPQQVVFPASLLALGRLGFVLQKDIDLNEESMVIGDVRVGETNPLEMAVKQSVLDTGRAEAAQATVDQVKMEGVDTNVAVMKELLYPVIELANHLHHLAGWEDSYKSTVVLLFTCYTVIRGWIRFMLPSIFLFAALFMLWQRHFNKGRQIEAFRITPPRNQNAVEQLLTLQEAIMEIESLIQAGNIVLLKIRALLFAALPQATERVALLLVSMAAVFVLVPLRYIILLLFVEVYTREMPYRKESSEKWLRRIREWWFRIPAIPVRIIKPLDSKKKN